MTWTWRYDLRPDADPTVGEASAAFPAQADAETWIGMEHARLLDLGVEAVTLLEDDREVYGPMSLRPDAG